MILGSSREATLYCDVRHCDSAITAQAVESPITVEMLEEVALASGWHVDGARHSCSRHAALSTRFLADVPRPDEGRD